MIINGIGFIIGFFNKDAGQALKDFSFKDMFNAYIDKKYRKIREKNCRKEEGVERDKLIEELKRVDDIIRERQGIEPPMIEILLMLNI